MADLNAILRRSPMLDTSGAMTPPAIQAVVQQVRGGGVYTNGSANTGGSENVLTGRISLGIVGAFVVGAVAFYLWTHEIQGGG